MTEDLYALLGVDRRATPEEIKKAYRGLARTLHPDANPENPKAEARFKQVAQAYEVLSDPEKRAHYDRFGSTAGPGGTGDPFGFSGGGLGDIFDAFFGGSGGAGFSGGSRGPTGQARGVDLEVVLDIEFEKAVFGAQEPVQVRTATACDTCEATGAAPGTHPERCRECNGQGQVRRVRNSILGQMVTATTCPRCGGLGQTISSPCTTCAGEGRKVEEKTYTVDIPAGVDTGSTLRLTGLGAIGPRGGGTGDLYVHLRVRPSDRFERNGNDLVHELHLPFTQAAIGAHLTFETLDGPEDLIVPKGTMTGRVFRLRGRGVPHVQGRGRGDLLLSVVVDTPTHLDEQQESLIRELAVLRGEVVAPVDSGLFSKIRSAFK